MPLNNQGSFIAFMLFACTVVPTLAWFLVIRDRRRIRKAEREALAESERRDAAHEQDIEVGNRIYEALNKFRIERQIDCVVRKDIHDSHYALHINDERGRQYKWDAYGSVEIQHYRPLYEGKPIYVEIVPEIEGLYHEGSERGVQRVIEILKSRMYWQAHRPADV